MFHTPNLTGLKKKYVPRRINEGWGLQHMKLYGIDDEIILSGCETTVLIYVQVWLFSNTSLPEQTSQTTTSPTD